MASSDRSSMTCINVHLLQLEELDQIFAAKNPVKASLSKKEILVSRDGDVVDVKEASP